MTLDEILHALAIFGVTSDDIDPLLESLDVSSFDAVQDANDKLQRLKTKARKGFRQIVMNIHPDHSSDPADHATYNAHNTSMNMIEQLTAIMLSELVVSAKSMAEDVAQYEGDGEAQERSFMAMAKWYKGPMIPVGWHENTGDPTERERRSPSTPIDPSRTFVKYLPDK